MGTNFPWYVTGRSYVLWHDGLTPSLQTQYTRAAQDGPGWLCHPCVKASGVDPFKKATAPRKRKPATEKRNVTHFEERRLPSLASLCVAIVSRHIDDVEALGDIGSMSMDKIAKAIAKDRSLYVLLFLLF